MIEVSQAYKDTLTAGLRNFNAIIDITLADGTIIPTMTNANLRDFSIDEAISDDNKFTALGSVIISQCVMQIDDMSDAYYYYNFYDAVVIVHIDTLLLDGTTERIRKGTFFVEDYRYLDGVIELTCYDYLAKFDKSYTLSNLAYPASVQTIVDNACSICGVTLSASTIEYADTIIPYGPTNDNATFREVLSWVGQIIGCYVRCTPYGELEFAWCDVDVLNASYGSLDGGTFDENSPYASGDNADGGSFNPWNTGYVIASASFDLQGEAHNLYYNYSQEVAVVDTLISNILITVDPRILIAAQYKLAIATNEKTGVLIFQKTDDIQTNFYLNDNDELIVESYNDIDTFSLDENGSVIMETETPLELSDADTGPQTISYGEEGFTLSVENNELLNLELAEETARRLGKKLIGMRFRKVTTSHMNDPTMEAGDIAIVWDRRNRSYPIIVTHTTFKIAAQQRTICGSETFNKNSATRYSASSKIYNQFNNSLQLEQSLREQTVDEINTKISALPALYGTIESADNHNIYYIHDQLDKAKSELIWRMEPNNISVSTDGGNTWSTGLSINSVRGTGTFNNDGVYKIQLVNYTLIMPAFSNENEYSVFLQKRGPGDLWVSRKSLQSIDLNGTANLAFDWEIRW